MNRRNINNIHQIKTFFKDEMRTGQNVVMTFSSSVFPFIIHKNWIEREIKVHFAFSKFIRCSPLKPDCHFWVTSSYPCLLPSWIIYLLQTHNSIYLTIILFSLFHLSRENFYFPLSYFLSIIDFFLKQNSILMSTFYSLLFHSQTHPYWTFKYSKYFPWNYCH